MKKIIFSLAILISLISQGQQRVEMKRDSGVTHVTPYSLAVVKAKIKADSIALRAAMGGGSSQNLQQVTDLDSVTTHKITVANLNISGIPIYVNQDSAVAHGLTNGDVYYTGFVNGVWQTAVVAPFPDHWELLVHYTNPGSNYPSLNSQNINAITVYWGDGTNNNYVNGNSISHTYADSGLYAIKIFGSLTGVSNSYISASNLGSYLVSTSAINGITGFTYGCQLFANCSNITSLPSGMFDNCPAIVDFEYVFQNDYNLATLPVGLFAKNNLVTSYGYAFSGDTSLVSIPVLFGNNTTITNFNGSTFANCTNLKSIASGLFDSLINVTDFSYTFNGDTALRRLPDDLFRYNTAVTSFYQTFNNCPITTLPAGLIGSAGRGFGINSMLNWAAVDTLNQETFKYFTGATTEFASLFNGNTVLTTLPDSLFYWNTAVTTFNGTFGGNTALTTIPAQLFQNNVLVTDFGYTFNGNTALAAIPLILFDNNILAADFSNCFNGDAALLGNAPPLWVTYSGATGTGCFTGDTGLTNYAAIDAGWK